MACSFLTLPAGRGGQGHFDYGKASSAYAGTEWEPLLNIDSVTYRRDVEEAEAMLNRILKKAAGHPRPAVGGAAVSNPPRLSCMGVQGRM